MSPAAAARLAARLGEAVAGSRGFLAGVAMVAVLFGGLTTWELMAMRRAAYLHAAAASENVASSVAHEIAQTMGLLDLTIRSAIDTLANPEIETASPALRRRVLLTAPSFVSFLGVMLITDASGQVIIESGSPKVRAPDVSDRPYFYEHRDHPDLGLLVAGPITGKVDPDRLITLSRSYRRPDGSFAGVVANSLRLEYFRDLTRRLSLGNGGALAIVTDHGDVLGGTAPHLPAALMAAVTKGAGTQGAGVEVNASGTPGVVSRADGAGNLVSFARAGDLPISVVVTTPLATVYASWLPDACVIGGGTILLVIALLTLAVRSAYELHRRRAAERSSAAFAAEYRMLAESTPDIILCADLDGMQFYVSPAAREILGYDPNDMLGRPWEAFVHAEDQPMVSTALQQLREGTGQTTVSYRAIRADDGEVWLEARMRLVLHPDTGAPPDVVSALRDVTWQRTHEKQLNVLVSTDGLTGVANRRMFDDRLAAEWRRAQRGGTTLALVMLDVDCFKQYNDCYGHLGGDMVLRTVGACLQLAVGRPGDLAARYGGEEFAVLLPETDLAGAARIGENIRLAVASQALAHARSPHGFVTVSVGVAALRPGPDMESAQLVGDADLALYAAKQRGRNQLVVHSRELGERAA